MRRIVGLSVLLAGVLVVLGLVLADSWNSDDDERNKATALEHVSEGLKSRGAPPQFTRCYLRELDANLTEEEVQQVYADVPDGAPQPQFFVDPQTLKNVRASAAVCGRELIASGEYTRQEAVRLLRSLGRSG